MRQPAIEATGLSKRYGAVRALRGVDLTVETGSIVGLLGPNGAGKTTAVRILTTLLRPDAGSARVLGLDVVEDAARLRERIGLAGQHAAVDENLVDRFRSLPMWSPAVVAGRILGDVGLNILQLAIMFGVGVLVGFCFAASAPEIVIGLALLLFLGYAFSWVFAFIGLTASSPEAANAYGFTILFPLTFISSAFVPVQTMPSWLQPVAQHNPFTAMVDAARALFIGTPAGSSVWLAFAWGVVITVVFAALSIWRYRRAVAR